MKNFFIAIILIIFLQNFAAADTDSWITISFGQTHIFKSEIKQPKEFGLGIIFPSLDEEDLIDLRPFAGFKVNFDRSYYIYGSFIVDFNLDSFFKIALSAGVGKYIHGSIDSIDLGFPLEFRESIELILLLFRGKLRLTLGFDHLSNAGLGKYRDGGTNNTGTESIYFSVGLPLNV